MRWPMHRDRHVQPIWMNLEVFLILIFYPPHSTLEILKIVSKFFSVPSSGRKS